VSVYCPSKTHDTVSIRIRSSHIERVNNFPQASRSSINTNALATKLGNEALMPRRSRARSRFLQGQKQECVTVTDMWRNTLAPAVYHTAAWLCAVHDVTWQLIARGTPVRGCVGRNFVVLFYRWYFALTAHSFLLLLSRPISKAHRIENKCHSYSGTSNSKYQVFFYLFCWPCILVWSL